MRTHRSVPLVAVVLLLAGACSSERQPAETPSNALLTEIPTRCTGLGPVPARGQVTFVSEGRVVAARANGARARCIADGVDAFPITWGGTGDRFLQANQTGADVYLGDAQGSIDAPAPGSALQGLSRPEGTQVVFVTDGGSRLIKVPSEGGPENDISFLARHDEAIYHPAGTHVAVVGEDDLGNYGIFLATNEGKEARQLVAVNAALEVYAPAFSHDGDTMYYVADHGGRWDLHVFSLSTTPDGATERQLGTVSKFDRRIDRVTVSEFAEGQVAFRVGDCESGFHTYIHREGETYEPVTGLGDIEPVGWLPNDDLIVAASSEACEENPSFDLHRVRLNDHDLLVASVNRPAIRAALPPPPDPPGRTPEVLA